MRTYIHFLISPFLFCLYLSEKELWYIYIYIYIYIYTQRERGDRNKHVFTCFAFSIFLIPKYTIYEFVYKFILLTFLNLLANKLYIDINIYKLYVDICVVTERGNMQAVVCVLGCIRVCVGVCVDRLTFLT